MDHASDAGVDNQVHTYVPVEHLWLKASLLQGVLGLSPAFYDPCNVACNPEVFLTSRPVQCHILVLEDHPSCSLQDCVFS